MVHWEVSTIPVVVILWDINKKSGYWALASAMVTKLDEENPDWRNGQKEVSVRFPAAQTTDDNGFVILRMHLIKEGQDSITRWFMRKFTVAVPDAPEAKVDLEAFLHFQATGERVTIDGKYLQMNERDARLLGPILDWPTKLTFMGISPSKETYPIKLEIESSDSLRAEISYIELRLVKRGSEQFTYANGHEATPDAPERKASPFFVSLTQKKADEFPQITLSLSNAYPTAQELRRVIPFWSIFLAGGRLRLTYLKHGEEKEASWVEFPAQGNGIPPEYKQMVEMLCAIEIRTGCIFHVPDWRISAQDAETIENALAILATGRDFRSGGHVNVPFNREILRASPELMERMLSDLEKSGGYISIETGLEEQKMQLLGTEISLGLCGGRVTGRTSLSTGELRKMILSENSGEKLSLELVDVYSMVESQSVLESLSSQ